MGIVLGCGFQKGQGEKNVVKSKVVAKNCCDGKNFLPLITAGCFGIDITSFCICILQSQPVSLLQKGGRDQEQNSVDISFHNDAFLFLQK